MSKRNHVGRACGSFRSKRLSTAIALAIKSMVLGTCVTLPSYLHAADFHYAAMTVSNRTWMRVGAWLEGAIPGAADRAVFGSFGSASFANPAIVSPSSTVPEFHIGSVLILDGTTTTSINTNHGQAPVHVHGVDGVGAEAGSSGMVNFFFHSYWESDLVMRANNPAGGGWRIPLRVTFSDPSGIDIGAHTITFDTVNLLNVIEFENQRTSISGTGNVVKVGQGTLLLRGVNTYSGTTRVDEGTLRLENSGSIASSSAVDVDGTLDISATTAGAAVNALTGSGRVALGSRTLTLASDGNAFSGTIEGTGGIRINGDTWLGGGNTYTGGTTLLNGQLSLGSASAIGTGTLTMAGGTTLHAGGQSLANNVVFDGPGHSTIDTGAASVVLSGALSGMGGLNKAGTGALTLTGPGSYAGPTLVSAGSLISGGASALSSASAFTVASGATLDLAGNAQSLSSLQNSGVVALSGTAPGTVLTLTGPYAGNNGVLRMSSVLGDSSSPSDRLVLDGAAAVASGQTSIELSNAGGLGAATTGDGIQLVGLLNGASYDAGAFTLASGVLQAGAYTYSLNSTGTGVYLSSGTMIDGVTVQNYRPEVALHAAMPQQMRQSAMAMLGNLHQRIGDRSMDATSADATLARRAAWGRLISGETQVSQSGALSPESRGRFEGFQVGTDLFEAGSWRTGIYVGQLEGESDVRGFAGGTQGRVGTGYLRSRYVGAYGTFFTEDGTYVDLVIQAGDHDFNARTTTDPALPRNGRSRLASVEFGREFALGTGWSIEPQLQAVYADQRIDATAIPLALIDAQSAHGWTLRAGMRLKGRLPTGAGVLQPYGRLNLYRTAGSADVIRVGNGGVSSGFASASRGNWGEAAIGFAISFGSTWSAYGELGKLFGTGGGMRVDGQPNVAIGVKARW